MEESIRSSNNQNTKEKVRAVVWTVNKRNVEIRTKEIEMSIKKIIEFEEGFRDYPYLCSEGYVTIGYGTKLHKDRGLNPKDFPIMVDKEIATKMLEMKVRAVVARITTGIYADVFMRQPEAVQNVLVSMAYQMGYKGLLKFKNMWKALDSGNYHVAAEEALDSLWAKQTPARAQRHAMVIANRSMQIYGG